MEQNTKAHCYPKSRDIQTQVLVGWRTRSLARTNREAVQLLRRESGGFRRRFAIHRRCMQGCQAGQIALFTTVVNDMGDFAAEFIAMHDSVNKTMFHQELAALKSLR